MKDSHFSTARLLGKSKPLEKREIGYNIHKDDYIYRVYEHPEGTVLLSGVICLEFRCLVKLYRKKIETENHFTDSMLWKLEESSIN